MIICPQFAGEQPQSHSTEQYRNIGKLDNFRTSMPGKGPHSLTYPTPDVCNLLPLGFCYDDKNNIMHYICDNMLY